MSKYDALNDYLHAQTADRISLDFNQIESILEGNLPASARNHNAWWANNPTGHSHCRAWHDAGWRTSALDLAGEKVDFVRTAGSNPRGKVKTSPVGALAGTLTFRVGVCLTDPAGVDWRAENGDL